MDSAVHDLDCGVVVDRIRRIARTERVSTRVRGDFFADGLLNDRCAAETVNSPMKLDRLLTLHSCESFEVRGATSRSHPQA